MTSTTTLLRAAEIAFPHEPWKLVNGRPAFDVSTFSETYETWRFFAPFNHTKGDLAALEHALQRAGWQFWYAEVQTDREYWEGKYFAVYGDELSEIDAPTPAERAMLCVEVMP
jgi:hypothetical protein